MVTAVRMGYPNCPSPWSWLIVQSYVRLLNPLGKNRLIRRPLAPGRVSGRIRWKTRMRTCWEPVSELLNGRISFYCYLYRIEYSIERERLFRISARIRVHSLVPRWLLSGVWLTIRRIRPDISRTPNRMSFNSTD